VSVSAESKGLICAKIVQSLGCSELRIPKDLPAKWRNYGEEGEEKVVDSKGATGAKTKTAPTDRRRTFVRDKYRTFLKIVKGKIG